MSEKMKDIESILGGGDPPSPRAVEHTGLRQLFPADYPEQLRETPHPPSALWIQGVLPPAGTRYLAVVGARKHSEYGRQACEELIAGLACFPIAIVSGLAIGIDGIAHEAALRAGLPTVAIPGSGLDPDFLYPRMHCKLAETILEKGGCLLSEYPPQTRARPHFFPERNRIMAGLCHAVLIVEAEQKSGTMITSKLALDYNREVLAVPGSIFSPQSEGPNSLVSRGATPALESLDILRALGIEPPETEADPNARKKIADIETRHESFLLSLFS